MDLVPGIQIYVSNRFYLDLSVPLSIYRTSEVTYRSQTSILPPTIDQLNYHDWLATFKSNYYQVRLGLGVNLNTPDNLSNTEIFHKTIKFNYNLVRTKFREDYHSTTLNNFSPAVTFQHKKLLNLVHVLELRNFEGENRHIGNSFNSNFLFSSRYQLNFFPWSKLRFLSPYAGLSFLVTYGTFKEYPNGILSKRTYLDYANAFVPGIQINPNKKIYFDISVPVNFFIAAKRKGVNYGVNVNQITTNKMFLPENRGWTLRFGIGLRI